MTPTIFNRIHDQLAPWGFSCPNIMFAIAKTKDYTLLKGLKGSLARREVDKMIASQFTHPLSPEVLTKLGLENEKELHKWSFKQLAAALEKHKKDGVAAAILLHLGCTIPSAGIRLPKETSDVGITKEQAELPLYLLPGIAKLLWRHGLTVGEAVTKPIRPNTRKKLLKALSKNKLKYDGFAITDFVIAADVFLKNLTTTRLTPFYEQLNTSDTLEVIGKRLGVSHQRVSASKQEVSKQFHLLAPFIEKFNCKPRLELRDLSVAGYTPNHPQHVYQTLYSFMLAYHASKLNRPIRFKLIRGIRKVRASLTTPVVMEAFIDAVCKELGTKNTDRPLIWKLVENLVNRELSGHDLIQPPLAQRRQLLNVLQAATRPLTLSEISQQVGLSEAVTYSRLSNLTDTHQVCRGEGKTYQWACPVTATLQKRIIALSQETLKTRPSFYPDELSKQHAELRGLLDGQICAVLKNAGFTIGLKKAVSLKNQPIKEAAIIIAEELAKHHPEPVSEQQLLTTIKSQRAFKSIQICPTTLKRAGAVKYGYRMYGLTPSAQMDVRKFLSSADFLYNFTHAHGAIVPLAKLEKSLGVKLSQADMETLATTACTEDKVRFVTIPQALLVKSKRSNTADSQFMHLGIGTQSQRRQMWDAIEAQKRITRVQPPNSVVPAAPAELKPLPTCWIGSELRSKVKDMKPGDRLKLPLLSGDINRIGGFRQQMGLNFVLFEYEPGQYEIYIGAPREQSVMMSKPLLLK